MPYFMDIHIFDQVTVEEVRQAHLADLSVQGKYGVKYLQFWVNEKQGTVFCLMEGPTAEACADVHREAHGNVACNITEVQKGFYQQFMGNGPKLDHGLVLKPDGKLDTGQRYLMVADLVNYTDISSPGNLKEFIAPKQAEDFVVETIGEFGGTLVRNHSDDSLLGVFEDENTAINCVYRLKRTLSSMDSEATFKLCLTSGQPMSEKEGFFEQSLREAQRLNIVAQNGEAVINLRVPREFQLHLELGDDPKIRILSPEQAAFIRSFFDLVEAHLSDSHFSLKRITRELGISRPQLYRRITEITGRSPNQFIRDIRLRRALALILENQYSVSEVAYEVGFGTPSYFTKRFLEKYGVTPSKVAG